MDCLRMSVKRDTTPQGKGEYVAFSGPLVKKRKVGA